MKYIFIFLVGLLGFNISYSQNINPTHIINLCSGQTVQGTTPTTNAYNNLFTSCSTLALSTAITLYYVEIESGSTFTFFAIILIFKNVLQQLHHNQIKHHVR